MNSKARAIILFTVFQFFIGWSSHSYDPNNAAVSTHETPKELEGVGITENLGANIDLSLEFVDESGEKVKLGKYFKDKPVIFSIIYYNCPSLCNYHLNGLTAALKELQWTVGDQFELVAISMNHREKEDVAKAKMLSYVESYGRPDSIDGWHFLTGSEENIKKIADQVGFGFKWIEGSGEYSHASSAQIITPSGKISRYLNGIEFEPQTVRLALLEASEGKIGSIVDQFVLYCFQFDPTKNQYTLYAYRVMQAGGGLIVFVMAIFLVPYWIREQKKVV